MESILKRLKKRFVPEDTDSAPGRSGDEDSESLTLARRQDSEEPVEEEPPRVTIVMGVDNKPAMMEESVELWSKPAPGTPDPDIVDVYAYLKRLCENYVKLMDRKERGNFLTPLESEKQIWSAAVAANICAMVEHIQSRMAEGVGDKTYAQLVKENEELRAELVRLKGDEYGHEIPD